jgi:hypothetical protein
MANNFIQIPDWLSFENQGAGIAIADLRNNGQDDLIVLRVDNPADKNQGYYKVGQTLDKAGKVTGGWGAWIPVPDWFSFENQGAGVAVVNLEGVNQPALIVFMIDNPPGQNQGYYKVGKRLDAQGNVTGGWGEWIAIPDWFPFENQHGSITVADLDQDGQPELIVFMVDNPPGKNEGYYRIGKKLDAEGKVTGGWSPWIPVPDWFSWENQGAGVAVADLENTGASDLIIFQIDNAIGQNQAFYKIGKNIGIDGTIVDKDWGTWLGVPAWFSWENQGGGIAMAPTKF